MGEDTKYCGHCKREVSAVNFTTHTVHCQRNIAVCSMCSEAVPRSYYQQHIEANHKSVPCPKCSAQIEALQLFVHEKELCPRRMVTCEHCELEITATDHDRHKEYCEARTERCKGCTKYVQFRYLQFHYETDHKYLKPEEKEKADENGTDDESSECPICLGPVTLPLALDCGHVFCMVCVKGIANTTKNCAICRRDITRDMLMDIRFCREEDIIKNYVNKPREKKTTRSHSVPSRGSGPGGRRLVHHTTEDYDEMVNALMSSRTTTASYRYQRPTNTHTPPSYTPYSSSTSNTESCQDSCKDSSTSESCKDSFKDDDCCCSSTSSTSKSSPTSSTTTTDAISTTASTSRSTTTTTSTSTQRASRDSVSRTTATSTSSSYSVPPRSSSASRALRSYSSRSSTTANRTATSSIATSTSSNSTSSAAVSTSSTSSAETHSSTTSQSASVCAASSSNSSSSSTLSNTTTSSSTSSQSSSNTSSTYSSSYSNGARPRRPTSLALETNAVLATLAAQTSSSNSRLSGSRSAEPPENATQEQYDRWLAFQLAKADDDLPPSEFNRKHKPTFRRSFSMPERPDHLSDSSSNSDSDSDTPSSRGSSRRPPASPRSTATSSSSSSASSSSRSTPISKSSSDSNASSSSGTGSTGSAMSTGARPKSSGLRKRVSFKEDAPPIRREAPVLLPCEFCNDVFPERDLMRHQTSCEHNETQLPRASRLVQIPPANNSTTASTTNLVATSSSSVRMTSVSSSIVTAQSSKIQSTTGPSSPPPRRRQGRMPTPVCTPPRKATAPSPAVVLERKSTDSPSVPARKSPAPILSRKTGSQRKSPEPSTFSPPPSCPSSISPPPLSPPPTTTITIVDQPPTVVVSPSLSSGSNRPFSVSPASSTSTNNSSASSGSLSSSSTTPSTSSSASPVPVSMPNPEVAPPDTPTTDIELDYDEEIPFSRPRKGRLLSSAIFSWRSISGSAATRRGGYARSNTAPLEDTSIDDPPQSMQPVTTSHSATQLPSQHTPDSETSLSPYPQIPRCPSPPKRQPKQISPPPQNEIIKEHIKDISPPPVSTGTQDSSENVFVKNPNKYKAPPPPPTTTQIPSQKIFLPPVKATESVTSQTNNQTKSPSPPPQQPQVPVIIPTERSQLRSPTPQENLIKSDITKSPTPQERNGVIKFDSKPMMNGFATRDVEMRINCEFCKQVFTPEKFRCHQTVCEAALRPVSRRAATPVDQSLQEKSKSPLPARHNKGPAPPPPPPPISAPPDFPIEEPVYKRLERSHSVKDDRSSYREGVRVTRRLERASSIKESRTTTTTTSNTTTTSSSYADKSTVRRWGSREADYGNGKESPSPYASSGWSGSTSNLYTGWSSSGSHAWSSHLSMVRDDLRTRAATTSINAIQQDNGGDSDNGGENEVDTEGNGRDRSSSRYNSSNSLLVEVRAALNKTSLSHYAVDTGGARYRERSTSRTRPASMYSASSGGWGSMLDLSSPSRQFNISDAFSSASLASKRRYIR